MDDLVGVRIQQTNAAGIIVQRRSEAVEIIRSLGLARSRGELVFLTRDVVGNPVMIDPSSVVSMGFVEIIQEGAALLNVLQPIPPDFNVAMDLPEAGVTATRGEIAPSAAKPTAADTDPIEQSMGWGRGERR